MSANATRPMEVNSELESRESRLLNFFDRTAHLRPNAFATRNGEFFRSRANQCLELLTVRLRLSRPADLLKSSLVQHIVESVDVLELEAAQTPAAVQPVFFAALAAHDLSRARFLSALPEKVLGEAPTLPMRRTLGELRVSFALFRQEDPVAHRWLELLEGLCFETDPAEVVTRDLERSRRMHPVLAALARKDEAAFSRALTAYLDVPESNPSQSSGSDFSLPGLGLCQLATLRGLKADVSHPLLPAALIFRV